MATLQEEGWVSLQTPPEELTLANTLVTGQSFRWRRTDVAPCDTYTGVIGQRLVQMRQLPTHVQYRVLARSSTESQAADAAIIHDYFNLGTSLRQLSQHWATCDPRYAHIAPALPGCRMLRQNPVECLFQFICSSNNHISRIHGMVDRLCSTYGSPLQPSSTASSSCSVSQDEPQQVPQSFDVCTKQSMAPQTPSFSRQAKQEPSGHSLSSTPGQPTTQVPQAVGADSQARQWKQQQPEQQLSWARGDTEQQQQQALVHEQQELPTFYAFPTLQQLSMATEDALRADGFGYRAKFIVGSVKQLMEQPEGGEAWLQGLRDKSYTEAHEALCSLPGVGPKVAACICLFSLDKHDAIPVDTHVWTLATKYYAPHLAKKSLTAKLHAEVQQAFVDRFGAYAGWAHNCLFISELASHRHLLPTGTRTAAAAATAPVVVKKQKMLKDEGQEELETTSLSIGDSQRADAIKDVTPAGPGAHDSDPRASVSGAMVCDMPGVNTPARSGGRGSSCVDVAVEGSALVGTGREAAVKASVAVGSRRRRRKPVASPYAEEW